MSVWVITGLVLVGAVGAGVVVNRLYRPGKLARLRSERARARLARDALVKVAGERGLSIRPPDPRVGHVVVTVPEPSPREIPWHLSHAVARVARGLRTVEEEIDLLVAAEPEVTGEYWERDADPPDDADAEATGEES